MRLNGVRNDDDRLRLAITGRPTDVRLAEIKVSWTSSRFDIIFRILNFDVELFLIFQIDRILIKLRVDRQCHVTQIPTKMVGFLIGKHLEIFSLIFYLGKKGAKIDQIRRESGVKIDIGDRLGEMTELRIYGAWFTQSTIKWGVDMIDSVFVVLFTLFWEIVWEKKKRWILNRFRRIWLDHNGPGRGQG